MGSGCSGGDVTATVSGMRYGVARPFPARRSGRSINPAATSAWRDCHMRPGPVPRSWHSLRLGRADERMALDLAVLVYLYHDSDPWLTSAAEARR